MNQEICFEEPKDIARNTEHIVYSLRKIIVIVNTRDGSSITVKSGLEHEPGEERPSARETKEGELPASGQRHPDSQRLYAPAVGRPTGAVRTPRFISTVSFSLGFGIFRLLNRSLRCRERGTLLERGRNGR